MSGLMALNARLEYFKPLSMGMLSKACELEFICCSVFIFNKSFYVALFSSGFWLRVFVHNRRSITSDSQP
jgi:hypothetical protein